MPLTREQVRAIDRRAVEEFGIPSIVLMENAGRQAADIIHQLNPLRERVLICCGPGNNGGDGLVIARHLDRLGVPVTVWLFSAPAKLSTDAAINHRIIAKMQVPMLIQPTFTTDALAGFGWIVDALFGTGLTRPLDNEFAAIATAINQSSAPVVAVDIPSGLDCDSGQPLGPTVRAKHTITFVGMKQGFLMPTAREYVGQIHFADIGAPRRLVDEYLTMRSFAWTP